MNLTNDHIQEFSNFSKTNISLQPVANKIKLKLFSPENKFK